MHCKMLGNKKIDGIPYRAYPFIRTRKSRICAGCANAGFFLFFVYDANTINKDYASNAWPFSQTSYIASYCCSISGTTAEVFFAMVFL